MHDAGHNVPPENERTHPDGQDGPNGPDGPDGRGRGQGKVQGQAADDTIRLNWREKLVEVGLFGAVIVSGMMIGSFIILFSLVYLHRTLEDFAPGFAEAGSIPFVFLVVLCAAIGNAVSFSCAPYLMRLIFRGYELKDERVDRALERLRTVTGMDNQARQDLRHKGQDGQRRGGRGLLPQGTVHLRYQQAPGADERRGDHGGPGPRTGP